jgi:hypothetical protein
MRPVRLAYVDESYRGEHRGCYVLAAVVSPSDQQQQLRQAAVSVLGLHQRVFHWHEHQAPRAAMLQVVCQVAASAVVAVATPAPARRQERARALCWQHLLWELREHQVRQVVIESRSSQDRYDRATWAGLRRAGIITNEWGFTFATKTEPALWLPDAVAGAVSAARTDHDPQWIKHLEPVLTVLDVPGPG